MATPEEEKVAAEKAAIDKKAADVQAAADKKAQEQMAADQRAAAEDRNKQPVLVVGAPGSVFSISGAGFGGSKGKLTIGGREVEITRWQDNSIKGLLPPAVKGAVELTTSSGVRKGIFPPPAPPVAVVTTTVTTVEK